MGRKTLFNAVFINLVQTGCAFLRVCYWSLLSILDSPRNVQSHLEYTPLEALVETQHEVSIVEDNDTALDLTSSSNTLYTSFFIVVVFSSCSCTYIQRLSISSNVLVSFCLANSQYNEEGRQKSLYVDVTGSPRKDAVRLPNVILGGKPGALPNTQVSKSHVSKIYISCSSGLLLTCQV